MYKVSGNSLFWKNRHNGYLNDNTGKGSLDNAPGGYFDMKNEFEESLGVTFPLTNFNVGDALSKLLKITDKPTKFGVRVIAATLLYYINSSVDLDIPQGKPSFIPSKSALAFRGSNKLLHENLSNRNLVCTNETPFDSYYAPNDNEEHITLNSKNMAWVLEELKGNEQPVFAGTEKAIINKTNNVLSGKTDNDQANNSIVAYNTISSGGNANYSAGSSITLKPGFHAMSGSNFKALIQNCGVSNRKNSFAMKNTNEIYKYSKIEHNLSKNNESENEELESIIMDRNSFLTIYPNPNNGLFNIQSSNNIRSYSVRNIFGNEIVLKKTNNQQLNIDISRFSTGIYFLELQMENGEIINKKILKK